jgi:LytS/YehU family sensor histidine kinase
VSLISVIGLSSWLSALVAMQMNLHYFKPATIPGFGALYLNSFINISIWVLLITTGKMIVDRRQTQQKLELLEKERINSELNYLKAQINPHALFNSLNTIYGHIDKSNQVARNILLQFSELLRYQLYDCSAEKVILDKEVEYLRNFVAFHRLRKTEGLVVDLQVENIEPGLNIAPLLLVVLAENAFKYVSNAACKESKIAIRIFTTGTTLHATFFNTNEVQRIPGPSNSNGIGIINLKRRLELLYPEKYKFSSHKENDFYETNLTIDLT